MVSTESQVTYQFLINTLWSKTLEFKLVNYVYEQIGHKEICHDFYAILHLKKEFKQLKVWFTWEILHTYIQFLFSVLTDLPTPFMQINQ